MYAIIILTVSVEGDLAVRLYLSGTIGGAGGLVAAALHQAQPDRAVRLRNMLLVRHQD